MICKIHNHRWTNNHSWDNWYSNEIKDCTHLSKLK